MAFTVAVSSTVFGNKRVAGGLITADAASDTIDVGLNYIDFISYAPLSMTTAIVKFRPNATAANSSSLGKIGISGVASGDQFYIVAYGQ